MSLSPSSCEVRDTPRLGYVQGKCPRGQEEIRHLSETKRETTESSLIKIDHILAQYCSKSEQRDNS